MRERDIDPEVIDTQDDGEPPSLRSWGDKYFEGVDPDYVGLLGELKLQQTGLDREMDRLKATHDRETHQSPSEAIESHYSERSAIQALTTEADRIVAQYGSGANGEGDVRIRHSNVMLTRCTSAYHDASVHDEKPPSELHAYFFVEILPDFDTRCRSWTSISEQVNWCETDKTFESANAVSERLAVSFPERVAAEHLQKRRFGLHILRRMMPVPTTA